MFKAHPRDTLSYTTVSRNSHWSASCSRSLIKSAKRVHGINSTVLFEAVLYGTETIIEGDCLLSRHADKQQKLLSALILWQFDLTQSSLSLKKIAQRSYLALDNYL